MLDASNRETILGKSTLEETSPLLQVRSLRKGFGSGKSRFTAVDDVSFDVGQGQIVALVGESGSGKSTVGRCILQLHSPDSGEVVFQGTNIARFGSREMRPLRKDMQIVFQDPFSSLDPRKTIGDAIGEGFDLRETLTRRERRERVLDMLQKVGMLPEHIDRYPHEFSGGQRQRIGIARALAPRPCFIVADEPVAALDTSVRSQVMDLIMDLQAQTGVAVLFISHDLGLVRAIADNVIVMLKGRIVEYGSARSLYSSPMHEYTHALLSASPVVDPTSRQRRQAAAAARLGI